MKGFVFYSLVSLTVCWFKIFITIYIISLAFQCRLQPCTGPVLDDITKKKTWFQPVNEQGSKTKILRWLPCHSGRTRLRSNSIKLFVKRQVKVSQSFKSIVFKSRRYGPNFVIDKCTRNNSGATLNQSYWDKEMQWFKQLLRYRVLSH